MGWVRWQRGLSEALGLLPICRLCSALMVKDVLSQHPCIQTPHWDGCLSPEPKNPSKPSFCKMPCSWCFFTAKGRKVTNTLHWVRQLLGLKRLRKRHNSCDLKQCSIGVCPPVQVTDSSYDRDRKYHRVNVQRKSHNYWGSLPAPPQPETRKELADASCQSKLLAGSNQ